VNRRTASAAPAVSEHSTDVIRVLIVTDQISVVEALRYGFPDDVQLSFVVDAREALRSLPEFVPSIVVVDLQTGSAGGYGLARDMAADSSWARVPVIMLLERDQDAWLARQAGARATLTKPVTAGRLTEEIRALATGAASPS
jgi:DNA-binding response OmpR family regulator